MIVVGTAVAVAAAKRGQVPELPPPLEFLAVPLGNLAIFAVLVAVGLYNRRKRDSHKRLMMLATIVTAGAASRTYLDSSCLVGYWRPIPSLRCQSSTLGRQLGVSAGSNRDATSQNRTSGPREIT